MKHAIIIVVGLAIAVGSFFVGCAVGRNSADSSNGIPPAIGRYSQWSGPVTVGGQELQYRTNLDSGEIEQRQISSQ